MPRRKKIPSPFPVEETIEEKRVRLREERLILRRTRDARQLDQKRRGVCIEERRVNLDEKRFLREESEARLAEQGLESASKINAQVEKDFAADDIRGRVRAAMSMAGANIGLVGSVIARAMASGNVDTAMDAVKLWSNLVFSAKGEKPAGDSGEDDEFGRLFEIALRKYKAGAGKAGSSKD